MRVKLAMIVIALSATMAAQCPDKQPSTALEIYHCAMAVFPVSNGYYHATLAGGIVMGMPVEVSEADADMRIRGYFHHPLPGMDVKRLGEMIVALEAPARDDAMSEAGYEFRITVTEIEDTATMFVSPE